MSRFKIDRLKNNNAPTRRGFMGGAGALAGALMSPAGFSQAFAAPALPLGRDPKTLIIGTAAAVENLDPATNTSWAYGLAPVYDTLLKLHGASPNTVVPSLAQSLTPNAAFTSWTCTLQPNVKFSSGNICDAAAVKASIVRTATLSIGQGYVWGFDDADKQMTVLSPTILRFDFPKQARPYFDLEVAGQYGFFIDDAATAMKHSTGPNDLGSQWLQSNPVGTGPYILTAMNPGQDVTYAKNTGYWGGWQGSHFDKIISKTVPLSGSRRQLLESGAADIVWTGTPEDTVALSKDPRFHVSNARTDTVDYIFLGNYGPLQDPRARQAMNYAFDNAAYITEVTRNTQDAPKGVFPSLLATADAGVGTIPFDLGKASELFTAAGVTRRTELTYMYYEGFGNTAGVLLQAWLGQIGIKLVLQEKSFSDFLDAYFSNAPASSRPNMYFFSWWPSCDHPYSFAWPLFDKDAWGANGGNAGLYSNDEVNKLLAGMNRAPFGDKLNTMSSRLQQILSVEDPPMIPIAQERGNIVCQTARKRDPRSASKKDPSIMADRLVQVANRRDPRARVARFKGAGVAGAWEVPVCPPGRSWPRFRLRSRWNASGGKPGVGSGEGVFELAVC